jgi:hypothetical protein
MKMILRFILSLNRKYRRRALGVAVWLLCQIRDAEDVDLQRYLEKLYFLDDIQDSSCDYEYMAIEGECLSCEHARDFLQTALDDLECAY